MEADSEGQTAAKAAEDPVDAFVRRLDWLDGLADPIQKVVGWCYATLGGPGRLLKDLVHGTKPLGHPLHPALTDIPLGAWTAMVAADLLATVTRTIPPVAGDVALGVGVAGALAAAVAGYTDFHDTYGQERRVGLLHGLLMTLVLVIMAVSLAMRIGAPGSRTLAVLVSTVGWLLAVLGGYLGGHLIFRYGTMVNRNAFIEFPGSFVSVGSSTDFTEGQMRKVELDAGPVLVLRRAGKLFAISNVCSHAGGPLDEGKMEGNTVICPWHGSRFCVLDGSVEGGPATFNQPAFTVCERHGKVEVKVSVPSH
jgi:nitrite reductase/ring-hydroxylating ferredoxin subunit/uncharacterized membrane protein